MSFLYSWEIGQKLPGLAGEGVDWSLAEVDDPAETHPLGTPDPNGSSSFFAFKWQVWITLEYTPFFDKPCGCAETSQSPETGKDPPIGKWSKTKTKHHPSRALLRHNSPQAAEPSELDRSLGCCIRGITSNHWWVIPPGPLVTTIHWGDWTSSCQAFFNSYLGVKISVPTWSD